MVESETKRIEIYFNPYLDCDGVGDVAIYFFEKDPMTGKWKSGYTTKLSAQSVPLAELGKCVQGAVLSGLERREESVRSNILSELDHV